MKHFLFEEKEYRAGVSFRRNRNVEDSARALARLVRRKGSGGKSSSGGSGGSRPDARQKCVVKAQYSSSRDAHRVQLDYYLVREGTGRDGGKAELYGTDLEEYRDNMADRNFRIFLSPQSDKVDLTALTTAFVKRMELQTGRRLYWQAANHYNTAHPHTHLLINGVDRFGKEVKFPKDLVKTFMREAARDLCTSQLGSRTREELELEKEREITASRWTKLDGRIGELCAGNAARLEGVPKKDRDRIMARLDHLRVLKLCVFQKGVYRMNPGWEENLRANGRYNVFLKARDGLAYSGPASLRVYTGAQKPVTGKVTKIYRLDEDASDNHAAVIEGLDGKAYFVPLMKKPELWDGKIKADLKEGELVTIKTYRSAKGRLTPLMFKTSEKQARAMIPKNGYQGGLTAEIAAGGKTF